MSKKAIIITVLVLIAAFFGGWAIQVWFNPFSGAGTVDNNNSSIPMQRNMGAGPGQGFRHMVNTLQLSDEQISAFSDIESRYRTQMFSFTQQLDSIDLAILNELKSTSPDKEKLDSLATMAGNIQYQLKTATADHFLAIKNLCNPTQKKRFNELITDINKFKRGQGRGQRHGRRGQGQGRNRRN